MKNFIKFLKTDIKIINSYFLLAVIFIILISIGYSSYALFSFTKTSSNVIEGKVGKINYTTNFTYTGECTTYIAKSDGYYNLEVWGAQGGNYNTTYVGGLGGYSKGIVHLTKGTTLYVCVGGQPQTVTTASVAVPGGFNGGGGGFYGGGAGTSYSDSTNYDKYSGGGSGYVYTSSTASSYPSGCLLNSTYYLTASSTTEAINTGHGKATITYIGKEIPLDTSGANAPVLASNMIPVYYDETNSVWKKADANNKNSSYQWYSYESSGNKKGMWANAVTVKDTNRQTYLNAEPGVEIPMDDITTMWVWIPRFKVNTTDFDSIKGVEGCSNPTYDDDRGDCESSSAYWGYFYPGAIDVTFVKQNEIAIDAFTFGNKELSGFWYGKFEISHTTLASTASFSNKNNLGCTNEVCSNANGIIIKPNVTCLRHNNISNFFFASRSIEQTGNSFGFVSTEVDTHMSKNNEWGAVAYLTQSIYGRCTNSTNCSRMGTNNTLEPATFNIITGYGAPFGSPNGSENGTYETSLGKDASTTGTIYGIYDMSGGAWEYVMGVYNKTIAISGFSSLPDEKYYNNYTGTSYIGHALTETASWYSGNNIFVNSSSSWFGRGGGPDYSTKINNLFKFESSDGNTNDNSYTFMSYSTRFVITNE